MVARVIQRPARALHPNLALNKKGPVNGAFLNFIMRRFLCVAFDIRPDLALGEVEKTCEDEEEG